MRRRILTALAVVTLLLGALPAVASASPANCVDIQINNQHAGVTRTSGSPSFNSRAGRAVIDAGGNGGLYPPKLKTCIDSSGSDLNDGSSAWVAFVPREGAFSQIVQIGVIRCQSVNHSFSDEVCHTHPGELRYFWAAGGCGLAVPYPRDLGPYPGGAHEFKVLFGTDYIYMFVDGGASIPAVLVARDDPGISCWIEELVGVQYAAERIDRGDSFGTSSSPTAFIDMQYKVSQSGSAPWYDYEYGVCHFNDGGSAGSYNRTYCTKPLVDRMNVFD